MGPEFPGGMPSAEAFRDKQKKEPVLFSQGWLLTHGWYTHLDLHERVVLQVTPSQHPLTESCTRRRSPRWKHPGYLTDACTTH